MIPTATRLGIRLIKGLILSVIRSRNLDASNLLCTANYIPATCARTPLLCIQTKLASFQTYIFRFYQNLRKLSSSIPLVILLSIMAL